MSKIQAIKGVLKTLAWLTREEWGELDHKLFRILMGAIVFIFMGLFWFYFMRTILPF